MPIYEYQCTDCGAEFQDLVLSRSAESDVTCKQCSSSNVGRMLSAAAVHSGAVASGAKPVPTPRQGGCGGGCACH